MKKIFLTALIVCLYNASSFAQYTPNTWVSENTTVGTTGTTSVPGRYFGASFTIGTTIYIGPASESGGESNDFWGFNTLTNTWTRLADFPGTARDDAIGFSVNGIGYMGLGDNGTYFNDMYQYNPTLNTWSPAASLPTSPSTGLADASAFSINGKGYVCLGAVNTTTIATNDLYEYDPATNTWTAKAPFIGAPRSEAISFVIDSIAYVGTGYTTMTVSDFYSYNPATNTWATIASLPGGGRNGGAGFSVCGYGYAGLGGGGSDFYQYDPITNAWATMDDYPGAVTGGTISASVNVIGDTAFGFVGFGRFGTSFPSVLYKYYPPAECIPITPISSITGTDNVCVDSTTTLSDVTSGGTWTSSNTAVATIVASTGILTGIAAGIATISYTVSGSSVTVPVTVTHCTSGVTSINNPAESITIYPNPTTTELTITSQDKINTVAISNLLGQTVYKQDNNVGNVKIDVANLPAGVYFVKVNGSAVRKFVKQ